MTAVAPRADATGARDGPRWSGHAGDHLPRPAADPLLPVAVARGVAFACLAGFAALHWMALLEPGEPGRALLALLVAGAAILGLRLAARLEHRWRQPAAIAVALVALLLALLAGGVPAELVRPSRWGELAAGISRGIQALPGVRVPYRGVEEWIRTIIPLGGVVLVTVAALLAFWPRRERLGRPGLALLALVILYAVPAVALVFTVEFLRGAVLAVLVVAFLRVDKVRVRDARLAATVAGLVAFGGLVVAPALNTGQPWWDYETWALEASSAKTTAFAWDHSYGPLTWPRDGRELLRVQAKRPAYWKAENLDGFDGLRWIHINLSTDPRDVGTPGNVTALREWTQDVRVSVRNLRSDQLITGGYTSSVRTPTIPTRERGDGTYLAARPLRRGDAYAARIYSPQPSERQRRQVPATDDVPLTPYVRLMLQARGELGAIGTDRFLVTFPRWGTRRAAPRAGVEGTVGGSVLLARVALTEGPYARVWNLAQRLRRGARTQEDYVASVLAYLRGADFSYSELPPPAAQTLPGFLLDAKIGYCQQYSGAMALLLRMGGVPARVATGFTSGALDSKTREYVVRDLDAHSWVEVWYPEYGWITFDPTPAAAPPRAQPDEAGSNSGRAFAARAPNLPGDSPGSRQRRLGPAETAAPWWPVPLAVAVVLLVAGLVAWRWRRRGRTALPAVAELERALRRARRTPGPGTTLRSLETAFGRTPAAADYVRALRDERYAGRPVAPTRRQRRALRVELRRGAGIAGWLRSWWAVPPT